MTILYVACDGWTWRGRRRCTLPPSQLRAVGNVTTPEKQNNRREEKKKTATVDKVRRRRYYSILLHNALVLLGKLCCATAKTRVLRPTAAPLDTQLHTRSLAARLDDGPLLKYRVCSAPTISIL